MTLNGVITVILRYHADRVR